MSEIRYRIGLMGAHRTGKTTLATHISKRLRLGHMASSASEAFEALGLDPKRDYDFATRLRVQRRIIEQFRAARRPYGDVAGGYVCDRTPLDFLAYTLADIGREPLEPMLESQFLDYQADCLSLVNASFDRLILIQPGITLIDAPGKAPANMPYIEHLNRLMRGYLQEPTLTVPISVMDRSILNIEAREHFVYRTLFDALYPAGQADADPRSDLGRVLHGIRTEGPQKLQRLCDALVSVLEHLSS